MDVEALQYSSREGNNGKINKQPASEQTHPLKSWISILCKLPYDVPNMLLGALGSRALRNCDQAFTFQNGGRGG